MRTHLTHTAALAALVALAACGEQEPEVVNDMYDPEASEELAAEEAELGDVPPMVRASRSYRCADNSVVYVTFYTEDAQVGVTTDRSAPPTILPNEAMAAAEDATDDEGDEASAEPASEGPARFSGDGMTLVGTGDSITYNGQTCNA